MSALAFTQYTAAELEIVMRLDRALADEVFSLHRQGYDMREVLHEARAFRAEADLMKRELQRRRKAAA